MKAFDDARAAHSTTDAHRYQSVAGLAASEFGKYGDSELGSGGSQGMAESDGASIDIHPVWVELEMSDDRKRLRGEGLVKFDKIDLV